MLKFGVFNMESPYVVSYNKDMFRFFLRTLKFGIWNFSGVWSLEFGVFSRICLLLCLFLLPACDHRVQIGPDYTLVTPESSDIHHPGRVLLYRGQPVWPRVVAGSEKSFQNGVFVFASLVPADSGNYDFGDSLQLLAIRGQGPPVLISERIYGQPMDPTWQVRQFDAEPGGITVRFVSGRGSTNVTQVARLATWVDIERWLLEAQGASVEKVTPVATYRLLQFKAAVDDSSIKGTESLEKLKGFEGK